FPPDIAAGIVLIGSCSSGLASNVMNYIARANLPLSITITAVTTMLAPIATPLWMKLLAGRMIEVDFFAMMMEITKLIIVPIGAAMLDDYLEHASQRGRRFVFQFAAVAMILLAALIASWDCVAGAVDERTANVFSLGGFLLGAVVAGVVYHGL